MIKRTIIPAAVAALVVASCTTGHEAEPVRQRIDLQGMWQTEIGDVRLPGTTDESHVGDSLKQCTETGRLSRRFSCVRPVTYTSTVEIPESMSGKHLRLIMEKTKPSTLWIDGDSIGSYRHLHTPHVYDISGIEPGQHKIEIIIDNSPAAILPDIGGSHAVSEHTQTNWNGILGQFCIEASAQAYIEQVQAYPDAQAKTAKLRIVCNAPGACNGTIEISGKTWNTDNTLRLKPLKTNIQLQGGMDTLYIDMPLGNNVQPWSEFDPALYHIDIGLTTEFGPDEYALDFGVRNFATDGTNFSINGLKTFLRGKHDACVFPLTGYAPMTVEEWLHVFDIAKSYGINHYRFHSWTPPRAAFAAADIAGIYLQPEMPYWGELKREKTALNDFLKNEGELILDEFGNHPSFVMMAHGNELCGDVDIMREWIESFRRRDPRHLYAFGSNNNLGFAGHQQGEDFFVACRVGGEMPGQYNTHVRASFSFADAADGGILNGTYPNTRHTYTEAIKPCPVPVISHENAQFQIYPDSAEIEKYTGVLAPVNHEIFRDRLKPNHLQDEAGHFHSASGALSMACYKADFEICLRTPGFGGFQVLDLQDYPGQGSALVGPLDAFMESKGVITPEEFRTFCDRVVVMAEFDRYTWRKNETFNADIVVANYDHRAIDSRILAWEVLTQRGHVVAKGETQASVAQGGVQKVAAVNVPLAQVDAPAQLRLVLRFGDHSNSYPLWVYPADELEPLEYTTSLTPDVRTRLEAGESILFVPPHADIERQSVGGLFTPDYWNYAMFKSISENLGRPVSPGTLGYAMNAKQPFFEDFPTENHSNWQWWIVAKNSRPFMLDGTPAAVKPIVWAIDNVERNHKLGVLFEFAVGKGKLLVSTTNLKAITHTPEGVQYHNAIARYLRSDDFAPENNIAWDDLVKFFTQEVEEREIIGVENITDYTGQ